LDSNSERTVQEALKNIRKLKQVTTVTVAHRLSTIMDSDQIAVIANGSIAELGTHRSLFEESGIYTTLCESQGITADSQVGTADEVEESEDLGPAVSIKKVGDDADVEEALVDDEAKDVDDLDELKEEPMASMSRLWVSLAFFRRTLVVPLFCY
jgi:ABC-type multidrug transport system ATPase subunit